MALRDPIAVYNAATNVEAHLIRNLLAKEGIEAHVTEDVSQVGTWMGGLIPEIHKPQVWVERANALLAGRFLGDYERRAAELRNARVESAGPAEATVEAVCEECGTRSTFPAAQQGSVQVCPECGEYVDVGEDVPYAEPDTQEDEEGEAP